MPMKRNAFLEVEHPAYTACKAEWARCERMMQGGDDALQELVRFDWELEGGEHYTNRQKQAVYTNFADRFATLMVGHMMRQAPSPDGTLDFGTLGTVRRIADVSRPTPAELIYYNADGMGVDGSQWYGFWDHVGKWAICTGLRWVMVEGPPEDARSRRDERRGLRPFLSDYSPLSVTNWHYDRAGVLAFAIIKRHIRNVRIEGEGENANLEGNEGETEYLLCVREGFTGFGAEYAAGGWWTFDEDGELTDEGDFEATEGDIPLVPIYYERVKPTKRNPRIARSGVQEIINASVLLMNLHSAAAFDAWDAATSVQALRGVDSAGFNLFIEKVKEGSRYAPLPMAEDAKQAPDVVDASQGVVVADVFDRRIRQVKETITELMLNEVQVSPDASGVARKVSWTDVRSPKLVRFATHLETGQNAVIHWLEQMWMGTGNPEGSVEWKRSFDLIDPQEAGTAFFEMERLAGVSSPTLKTKIMVQIAKAQGFLGDDTEQGVVEAEYTQSSKDLAERMKAGAEDGTTQDRSAGGGERGTSRESGQGARSTAGAAR